MPLTCHFDLATKTPALFPDAGGLRRNRNLSKNVKNFVSKKGEEKNADYGEDRTVNFAAINLRPPKGAEQTDQQQSGADAEQQKIRPRKIAREGELGEELVSEHAADSDNESDPERPIPFSLHVDLAEPTLKIHR